MTAPHRKPPSISAVGKALARAAVTSFRRRYDTIDAHDLNAMLRSDEPPTVVDVRLAEDFAAGHIDGALSRPFRDADGDWGAVPRGRPIVSVCYLGMLSRTAAQQLVAAGHPTVFNLDRGMKGWREFTERPEGGR